MERPCLATTRRVRSRVEITWGRVLRLAVGGVVLAGLTLPPPMLAQEHSEAGVHGQEQSHGEHEYHENGVFLFLGGTTESVFDDPSTRFSIGLEYERRLSRLVGVVVGGDFVIGGEGREALAGLLLILRPVGRWGVAAGPGMEIGKEHHADGHEGDGGGDTEVRAALRVGVLYDFEVGGRYTIAPALFTDFIDGKDPALVWGVELGIGF